MALPDLRQLAVQSRRGRFEDLAHLVRINAALRVFLLARVNDFRNARDDGVDQGPNQNRGNRNHDDLLNPFRGGDDHVADAQRPPA